MNQSLLDIDTLFSSKQREEIKNTTWLITGVAGFIGSNQLDALLTLGAKVIGIDDFSSGLAANLPKDERFTLLEGSFYDDKILNELGHKLTGQSLACIHLAALASVPKCTEDPQRCFDTNVGGTFRFARFLSECSPKNSLVFASSSAVYGDCGVRAHEGLVPNPASIYGASKLASEVLLSSLCLPVHAMRYFNVFGPRQRGDSSYSGVISKWLNQMQGSESVTIYGDGQQTRDFIHVNNVVYANILAALRGISLGLGGCYNVAAGESVTLLHLFELLKEELGYHDNVHHASPRQGDIVYSEADVAKLVGELGFNLIKPFKQGLRDLVRLQRDSAT